MYSFGQQQKQAELLPKYLTELRLAGGRAFFDPKFPMVGFEPHRGIEARIGKYTNGVEQWSRDLKHPYYGLGFHYSAYGDKSIYGLPRAVYAFVGIPLWKLGKWHTIIDGAAGIAWGFNPHHPETNPDNREISSRVNVHFNVNAIFEYPISEKWSITTGVGMTHYSNSITRYPNVGVNIMHGNLGIRKKFRYKERSYFKPKLGEGLDSIDQKHKPYWGCYVAVNGGVKQIKAQGDIYNINSTYAEAFYRYSRLARVTFGADYFFDPSRMYPEWSPVQGPEAQHRVGVHVGHDFIINRAYLTTQIGGFVYEGYDTEEYFFFRLGGKIRVTKHMYVNATLMSFWVYAKMLEFGIGFNLY